MEKIISDPIENLKEIRSMMERSSRFLSLSGLSGIAAGIVGVAGGVLAIVIMQNAEISRIELINRMVILAISTLILAMTVAVLFTFRNSKKKGLKIWDKMSKIFLLNLSTPLLAGGVFCLILLFYQLYFLLVPCMLIFYGIALFSASNFTFGIIRFLGIFEMILGFIAIGFWEYHIYLWIAGFGILHIIYGTVMFNKYKG